MEKAISVCSEEASLAYSQGKHKSYANDDKHIYDFNITGKNTFGITSVEIIDDTIKEIINERGNEEYSEENKEYTIRDGMDESKLSNRNNESTRKSDYRTNGNFSKMGTEQQKQRTSRNERKSERNSKELAQTSSFVLPKNIDYKDNMNHVSDIFREDYSIFVILL